MCFFEIDGTVWLAHQDGLGPFTTTPRESRSSCVLARSPQANRTREKLVEAGIVSLLIRLSKVRVFER